MCSRLGRDDGSRLGWLMVSAFAIMSVLLIRLLLFLNDTFTNPNMKTVTFLGAKDTAFGQIPHRQRWQRALYRGNSIALENVCVVTVSQETSARHVTPTTKGGKQAHTSGKHAFKFGATSAGHSSERDDVSSLGMFMAAAFATLPFLIDIALFTILGMKTVASEVAQDTVFDQEPHRHCWRRALHCGISTAMKKIFDVTVNQEASVRHVTPTGRSRKQARTGGKHAFRMGNKRSENTRLNHDVLMR